MDSDKSLCLYCDKTFSNLIEQESHVERVHILKNNQGKGSRKSERITKNSGAEPFQGCFYCNNRKLASRCDDLEALFQHLLTAHKDVCYVCKCRVRLQNKTALVNHKKNCKFSDGRDEELESREQIIVQQKANKKRGSKKFNGKDAEQEGSLSDSEATSAHHHKTRTNAMNKKSENRHNSHSIINKRNYVTKTKNSRVPSSSSSTISSCSSTKASDEYTIPLTRQKIKDPNVNTSSNKSRTASNKKTQKASSVSSTSNYVQSNAENKNPPSFTVQSTTTLPTSKALRYKPAKTVNSLINNVSGGSEQLENVSPLVPNNSLTKNESLNSDFDDDFYKKISYNIKVNLNCFIDGKADRLCSNKFKIEQNADIKSNELQNHNHEKEIHEATNFELSTPPFPALLTAEQYGFGDNNPNKSKRQFTKNSWKWRWDLIKKYKYVNEGGKIVKKVKQITTGLKDLSQLDMWTQLSMRSRYESLNVPSEFNSDLNNTLSKRLIKSQNIEQLNGILDKRLTPEIHIEQMQQMLVKEELVEYMSEDGNELIIGETSKDQNIDLKSLQLARVINNNSNNTVSLSGEWARPRCFICIDCGQEFDLMKTLNDHKNSEHPYVVSAHYEVVGLENLERKLYKSLFLPKKALNTIANAKSLSINNDSKSNEGSSSSHDSSIGSDMKEKECTKCQKMIKYSSDIDIYRHILDCIEDKVWMQAKRRSKYRRSRRKPKKNIKKIQPKALYDQKRNELDSQGKDNLEGDDTTVFNTSMVEIDTKTTTTSISDSSSFKAAKSTSIMNENLVNSNDERLNIKSFFRVSKTTPNLPQKMVVQMLQMPNTHTNSTINQNSSLRQSLRSSTKKQNVSENIKSSVKSDEKINPAEETVKSSEITTTIEKFNDTVLKNELLPENEPTTNTLSSLYIATPEKIKSSLNSPTNSTTSSLVSPISCSSVPKKKKKLNDCIAMLTCKIQEKLGVNFFENTSSEIFPHEAAALENANEILEDNVRIHEVSSLLSVTTPLQNSSPIIEPTKSKFEDEDLEEQNQVIDLSLKRVPKNAIDNRPEENEKKNSSVTDVSKKEHTKDSNAKVETPKILELETHKVEELTLDSFKISIAKDKIPDFDDIIEKQNVITVNNLKISESERKAFEEQKNRIMQILGKKTTTKTRGGTSLPKIQIKAKKTNTKKVSKPEDSKSLLSIECSKVEDAPKDLPQEALGSTNTNHNEANQSNADLNGKEKKSNEICHETFEQPKESIKQTIKRKNFKKKQIKDHLIIGNNNDNKMDKSNSSETSIKDIKEGPPGNSEERTKSPDMPLDNVNIHKNIEQVIKSTNRIRCRRLSVVVDPIIHLPGFQNSKKIRLTNNSQQNGFYDLLTNDQIFNAMKNTPQIKKELQKLGTKKACPSDLLSEVKTTSKTKTINKKPTKSKKKSSKYATGKVMKVTKKKKKKLALKESDINKGENIKNSINNDTPNELMPSENTPKPPPKSPALKTSKSENSTVSVKKNSSKKGSQINNAIVERKEKSKKISLPSIKYVNKNNISDNTSKKGVERKNQERINDRKVVVNRKVKYQKLVKSKKTSKESLQTLSVIFDDKQYASSDTSIENDIPLAKLLISSLEDGTGEKTKKIQSQKSPNKVQKPKKLIKQQVKQDKRALKVQKIVKNLKIIDEGPKEHVEDTLTSEKIPQTNEIKCTIDTAKEVLVEKFVEKEPSPKKCVQVDENYEIFSMNEDSFFNDDNDVDQANDKINALVTNIINSSELVDSESEKIENAKEVKSSTCFVCNKTFKNEKVLEKHQKTSTHILKEKRKEKQNVEDSGSINSATQVKTASDDTKIFRTKGALKTFDNIRSVSPIKNDAKHLSDEFKPIVEDSTSFIPLKEQENFEDDDEELSTKDKIFDSLFSNIENKLQAAAKNDLLPKYDFPTLSHHDSESSSTSWDLKHDAEIDWDTDKCTGNGGIFQSVNNCKTTFSTTSNFNNSERDLIAKVTSVTKDKSTRSKEAVVPTKSLIMGKIFKRQRDKQKTPQADAPNNKPGIKNSLDEIFDHLKNSAEIDDKVLTCPSPKTLLKNSGGTFSPNSSHSNDMLESASHSNKQSKNFTESTGKLLDKKLEKNVDLEPDGIGKRKSRRRCAIKMKTFTETWSSDEYEELHDTNDIISIINEIEKRESTIKHKNGADDISEPVSLIKQSDGNSKKKVQISKSWVTDNKIQGLKKGKKSFKNSGHKSDDDLKNKPQNSQSSLKKRRMSCFVPSTVKFEQNVQKKSNALSKACISGNNNKLVSSKSFGGLKGYENKPNFNNDPSLKTQLSPSLRSINQPTLTAMQGIKRKNLKHRKRPRNKIKNIAYDSDSDFELNLSKKLKTTTSSTAAFSESENDSDDEKDTLNEISCSNKNKSTTTMAQPTHSLPNDLNKVDLQVTSTSNGELLVDQETHDYEASQTFIKQTQGSIYNRTKRHSGEKLYYWSSSSSDSDDIEQGDIPEGGENEHSTMIPQQHGWIVGDSHKKLVTLLAHAKIKNKIN